MSKLNQSKYVNTHPNIPTGDQLKVQIIDGKEGATWARLIGRDQPIWITPRHLILSGIHNQKTPFQEF